MREISIGILPLTRLKESLYTKASYNFDDFDEEFFVEESYYSTNELNYQHWIR